MIHLSKKKPLVSVIWVYFYVFTVRSKPKVPFILMAENRIDQRKSRKNLKFFFKNSWNKKVKRQAEIKIIRIPKCLQKVNKMERKMKWIFFVSMIFEKSFFVFLTSLSQWNKNFTSKFFHEYDPMTTIKLGVVFGVYSDKKGSMTLWMYTVVEINISKVGRNLQQRNTMSFLITESRRRSQFKDSSKVIPFFFTAYVAPFDNTQDFSCTFWYDRQPCLKEIKFQRNKAK